MTPQEYLEFTNTTRKPGLSDGVWAEYLRFGLIEEVGEFAGKSAKVVRDHGGDWDAFDSKAGCTFREAAILELGDVVYMVVQTLWVERAAVLGEWPYAFRARDFARSARKMSLRIGEGWADGAMPVERAVTIVAHVDALARWLDSGLAEVVERNVAKLSGRLVRGTISGQGDQR